MPSIRRWGLNNVSRHSLGIGNRLRYPLLSLGLALRRPLGARPSPLPTESKRQGRGAAGAHCRPTTMYGTARNSRALLLLA